MRELFASIKASIYSPAYYRDLLAKPFSYSLKYYLKFALIVSFVMTVVLSARIIPVVNDFLGNLDSNVGKYYPAELIMTIKNGELSTNVKEPYFMEDFLVIDTKTPFSAEQFAKYGDRVWLTKNEIIVPKGSSGGLQIQPLKDIPDFVVTKDKVGSWLAIIGSKAGFVPYLLVFAIFVLSFLVFGWRMLYLLIFSLAIWLLAKILGFDIKGYGGAYRVGLHAMTVPILLHSLLFVVTGRADLFAFDFTIVMLVIASLNLVATKKITSQV